VTFRSTHANIPGSKPHPAAEASSGVIGRQSSTSTVQIAHLVGRALRQALAAIRSGPRCFVDHDRTSIVFSPLAIRDAQGCFTLKVFICVTLHYFYRFVNGW
jgi:hypothetical protein